MSQNELLLIDRQSRFLDMKSLQPYSTTDEYLYAMKEDLADWLINLYPQYQPLNAENFLERLENGVLLCQHANFVNEAARSHLNISLENCKYRSNAQAKTFNARDNVSQFINWARKIAGVREVLMFESDDLILRKNEKNFILCLLEIARFGSKFGVSVPSLIKFEQEIERELERETQANLVECQTTEIVVSPPTESLSIVDLPSSSPPSTEHLSIIDLPCEEKIPTEENLAKASQLHKTVVSIVNSCCCAHRFPVIRIGEGKYRIGENGTIIFIRILRYHVMVRVGGGWDTLENYLNKHDPCRKANSSHCRRRSSAAVTREQSDIPILALSNSNVNSQKNSPNGKSVTLKTEEFPLCKPIEHDTNLNDAKLVITRDADGRHRIGQITYRSEENSNSSSPCRQHRMTTYTKQSSPSTDQDYSSLTEATTSKPSSSSSFDLNDDADDLLHLPSSRPSIVESVIDSIDDFARATSTDFDLRDVRDALTTMDNDSLESSEGVIERKKAPLNPKTKRRTPAPLSINRFTSTPRSKSTKILDRDSRFDEREYRRERIKSSSSLTSISSDFRENKSFELRLQKLESKRQMNKEQENLRTRRTKKSAH